MPEKKTETPDSHNTGFLNIFFKSMSQTVTQFPSSIIAETRVEICQLVAEMEANTLYEQNQPIASVFPFHSFLSSIDYEVPCYSYQGHVPPALCRSSTQLLSSPSPTADSCSRVCFRTGTNTSGL
jgi:hypothetical protein